MRKYTLTLLLSSLIIFLGSPQQLRASDTLKIMTWNVMLIPKIYVNKYNTERAKKIGKAIKHSNKDIVVLQELFGKKMYEIINDSVQNTYPYQFGPGKCGLYKLNSGVVMYSKYPISYSKVVTYQDACTVDRMAHKGAVCSNITYKNHQFQVIGTHLQSRAGEKFCAVRFNQLRTLMADTIITKNKVSPRIFMGDFNVVKARQHYPLLLKTLNAEDGELHGEHQFSSDPKNDLKGDDHKSTLDYILIDRNNTKVQILNRTVTPIKDQVNGKLMDLSDHFPVCADLVFH